MVTLFATPPLGPVVPDRLDTTNAKTQASPAATLAKQTPADPTTRPGVPE